MRRFQTPLFRSLVLLLLFGIALSWGCASQTPSPALRPHVAQTDLLLPDGRPLTQEAFAALARNADYILIGESHGSYCDHTAQAFLLRLLAKRNPPVLALEMVPTEKQPVLDRFNQGKISIQALPKALDWAGVWGHPFPPYAPVFQAAHDLKLPVHGLNVPRRAITHLRDAGLEGMAPAERTLLPRRIILPPVEQEPWLLEQMAAHHGGNTPQDKERFFLVQSLWDTALAQEAAALRADRDRPVAILAGSGHVTHGWGVAHRLGILDPEGRVVLVMPWRGGEPPEAGAAHLFYRCPLPPQGRLGMALGFDKSQGKSQGKNRVMVRDVRHGSPAAQAGLQPGDVILRAGGREARTLQDMHRAGKSAATGEGILHLEVERDGHVTALQVRLPKAQE